LNILLVCRVLDSTVRFAAKLLASKTSSFQAYLQFAQLRALALSNLDKCKSQASPHSRQKTRGNTTLPNYTAANNSTTHRCATRMPGSMYSRVRTRCMWPGPVP
jgi:hypothetical protein